MNIKRHAVPILALAAFLMLGACSHLPGAAGPRQALEARAERLWQARVAKDNPTIYALTDSTYRKNVSESDFLQRSGINVLRYEISEISIDGSNGLVKAVFESEKFGMVMRFNMNEIWVLEAGQWYLNLSQMSQKSPFGPMGKSN